LKSAILTFFQAKDITIYNTMWDGKSCTAIAKTYLPPANKLSSAACHLCLANPADMSDPNVWERPIRDDISILLSTFSFFIFANLLIYCSPTVDVHI
jgi:hypothetical protein